MGNTTQEQLVRREPGPEPRERPGGDSRATIFTALAANLVTAVAKLIAGLFTGSPALLSEAAHSVADSVNEVFLLTALRRARRTPDRGHPFGYGKERFFWSFLAAIGIFVTGGCFSIYQGVRAWQTPSRESSAELVAGIIVLGVALLAESASLLRALIQARARSSRAHGLAVADMVSEPALRTVIAEDGTAVVGVIIALAGIVLHAVTGSVQWEAAASWAIGGLLLIVATRLAVEAQRELIGQAVDPALEDRVRDFLAAQAEIDAVPELLTMRLGPDSALLAARVDLHPGIDSESIELVCVRVKRDLTRQWPSFDHVFLDITDLDSRRDAA